LSPTEAQQILRALINDRRISTADVNRYLEIQRLEERLRTLRSGGGVIGSGIRAVGALKQRSQPGG